MKHYRCWLLLIIFVYSLEAQTSLAQDAILTDVSVAARREFSSGWNDYLKYQKSRDWRRLYGLSIASVGPHASTFESFIEEMNAVEAGKSQFVSFVPSASVLVNRMGESNVWLIEGCGFYKRNKRTVGVRSGFNAMLHNQKWYLDYVTIIPDAVGGAERPCK